MSKPTTFVQLCLDGEADLDDIHDYLEAWHDSSSTGEVWDYLGLTKEEYFAWTEEPWSLRFVLNAKSKGEKFSHKAIHAMAARSAKPSEAKVIEEWLIQTGRL